MWYDYWSGERIESGDTIQLTPTKEMTLTYDKKKVLLNPALDHLPVFARAGAIIPEQPVVQNTDQVPQGPLTLHVFPGPNCSGSIYADDGNTFAYKQGEFYRNHITCEASSSSVRVTIGAAEGKYTPWWKSYSVLVAGASKRPASVAVNGQAVKGFQYDAGHGTLAVQVPATQSANEIVIQY
jgi:alpha-glucosidase